MKKVYTILIVFILSVFIAAAQNVGSSPQYIKAITAAWQGERFADGRPKVSDELLERLKKVPIEAAWSVLRNRGYESQFEGSWTVLFPDSAMTGRVVTAQYMPLRPDLDEWVKAQGKIENRSNPPTNSWPIDILKNGDVYVADSYGKVDDGPILGDNLANAIYAKSKRGVIVYGTVRDPEGMKMIGGFNSWSKGIDASFLQKMMLTSINAPIRIGHATVLPGDAVLAKSHGVLFIPSQLVEEVVSTSEVTQIRDEFGWQRLRDGVYTSGQIDSQWSEEIKKDFLEFVKNYHGALPMTEEEFERYMTERNW
jgi:4-hydroxy-4-methyl-2-oxoglutarate aldolase